MANTRGATRRELTRRRGFGSPLVPVKCGCVESWRKYFIDHGEFEVHDAQSLIWVPLAAGYSSELVAYGELAL